MPNPSERARPLARLIAGGAGWIEWVLLFVAAVALAGGLLASRLTDPLDALIHDAIVRATPRAPDPRILIVAIDDASIRDLGRWPWSREVHARMIDRLAQTYPLAVGYDVLFVEPGPGDEALRASVARFGYGTLAMPLLISAPGDNGAAYRVSEPVVGRVMAGHVVVRPDPDGVFRQVTLYEGKLPMIVTHLAEIVAETADEGTRHNPLIGTLIPFTGGPGHYPTVSFSTVLRGEVPPELLRERIILVGANAGGLGDRFATPVGGTRDLMSGIEVQANIVDALMHGGLRVVAPGWLSLAFATVALALLWAGFLFAGPRTNLIVAALVVAGVLGAAALLLVQGGWWIQPASALVAIIVMFPVWGWRRLAAASRFLGREIDRLGGGDVAVPAGGDPLSRQIALLGAAGERIERLRRQRDETLAFLSHDLRGPAAAILGVVTEGRVADHARRLLRLADQFVQVARAEEAPLVSEPVELAALLDEAADQCWEAAQRVGGWVTVACSWDLPELATDRALMVRAIVNLIDNALKYGGERPQVHVRGWWRGGQAVVTVADSGAGLTTAQVSTLFDRFDRAGAAGPDGAGLGLALVATFARRQGGSVVCISRVGVGSVFELVVAGG